VGDLVVADIGIPASLIAQANPRLWLLEEDDVRRAYPPRDRAAHKGRFGHVLVIGGSVGKTGAAVLAATGAMAAGAGLVTVATSVPALPLVAGGRPEIMTEPLASTPAGSIAHEGTDRALALVEGRDAVVLGPGLGQEPSTREFVRQFVRRCRVPLVVDADGLNALSPSVAGEVAAVQALRREAPTMVTPHPGEMARLIGSSTGDVQRRRVEIARALALETGAVVVLKGHRTVVVRPDGRAAVNPTGNPGMATGGSGDVLAGVMGALCARGLDAWTAATSGVYLHGAAGDDAAFRRGEEGLLAGDLLDGLAAVLRRLAPPRRGAEVSHS
jgi:NAD(P)H-hydrate epimerase